MKVKIVTYIAAAVLSLSACERHDEHREGTIDRPIENVRPPVEENRPFEPEIKDNVWRLTGPGINLRYDRGGVLFIKEKAGVYRILDLDGAKEAVFSSSAMRPDSMFIAPRLVVNNRDVDLLEAKMMKLDDTSGWIRLLSTDSAAIVLVVPIR